MKRWDEAIEDFEKAKSYARGAKAESVVISTLLSLADTYLNRGDKNGALRHYQLTRRRAAQADDKDTEILAAIYEGRMFFELGKNNQALRVFQAVLSDPDKGKEASICCKHAIGLLRLLRGDGKAGRSFLGQACREAREVKDDQWIVRSLTDQNRLVSKHQFTGFDRSRLRACAIAEEKRGNWVIAGRLWKTLAESAISDSAVEMTIVESALLATVACLGRKVCEPAEWFEAVGALHAWYWKIGRYPKALTVLKRIEARAKKKEFQRFAVRALDQRGVCLQELERFIEAISLHRQSVRMAKKQRDTEQLIRSLNNLGEAFRKLGDVLKASTALEEAQRVALEAQDYSGHLMAAENLALVRAEQGRRAEAQELLVSCAKLAAKQDLWVEYALAHGHLAELEIEKKRHDAARKQFSLALSAAERQGVAKEVPRLALNYARFLLSTGELSSGILVLKGYEAVFDQRPDAHLFHFTSFELLNRSNPKAAENHLRRALTVAELVQDRNYVAMCAANLAELDERAGRLEQAEKLILQALANEGEIEGRALLMIQRMRVRVKANRRIGSLFVTTREIAAKHDLYQIYIDAHLLWAEHAWASPSAPSKLEALKALSVALLEVLERDPKAYPGTLAQVIRSAINSGCVPTANEMAKLLKKFTEWLSSELGISSESLEAFTRPFRIMPALVPFAHNPKRFVNAFLNRMKLA